MTCRIFETLLFSSLPVAQLLSSLRLEYDSVSH